MTFGPVGIRCPDHSGKARGPARVVQTVQSRSTARPGIVTTILIAINVGVYFLQLAGGASVYATTSGWIYVHGALYGPAVAQGDWHRLITSAFLHGGAVHLGFNMLALWWIGRPLEEYLGPVRYLLLYLVSGLAGSAGALLLDPAIPTVGASGAIYGILGAALVLERQRIYVLGGSALTLLIVGLAYSLLVRGISLGGHLGGLAGGALCILALSRFGKGNAAYNRIDAVSLVSLVAIGLLSVAVAYWKVKGYA